MLVTKNKLSCHPSIDERGQGNEHVSNIFQAQLSNVFTTLSHHIRQIVSFILSTLISKVAKCTSG